MHLWSFKLAKNTCRRSGAFKSSKPPIFSRKLADFRFSNFENGAFKGAEHKMCTDLWDLFYGTKHSDASRPRNAPFCEEQWLLYLLKIHQNVACFETNGKHCSLHCQIILLGCLCGVSDVYKGLLQLRHQYRIISNTPKLMKCCLLWTKYHITILIYAWYLNKSSLWFERIEYIWVFHSDKLLWVWRVRNCSVLVPKL